MGENTKSNRAKALAQHRALMLTRMRASRHADAPCFVYVFALKEIYAIKVGISIDPLKRICDLPQFHLRVDEVFDLNQSIAVCAYRRQDARKLERAALKHHQRWHVDAPKGAVVNLHGVPTCHAPIRWHAGGDQEWLDASAYSDVLNFLLFADCPSPRPSISIANWMKGLKEGAVQ